MSSDERDSKAWRKSKTAHRKNSSRCSMAIRNARTKLCATSHPTAKMVHVRHFPSSTLFQPLTVSLQHEERCRSQEPIHAIDCYHPLLKLIWRMRGLSPCAVHAQCRWYRFTASLESRHHGLEYRETHVMIPIAQRVACRHVLGRPYIVISRHSDVAGSNQRSPHVLRLRERDSLIKGITAATGR